MTIGRFIDAGETVLINAAQEELPGRLQRYVGLVGSVADGGKLWASAAAVLAVAGRAGPARRSAGSCCLPDGFWRPNVMLKQLTRRARPGVLADCKERSATASKTTSLPSSHTAGGVAFAVRASSATPAVAPVLGGLARSVAADRILGGDVEVHDEHAEASRSVIA